MKTKVLFTALLSIVTMFGVSAQKLTGNLSPLKGQEKVNVIIDFSGTTVNGKAEEVYIANETRKMNDADKEKWLKEWNEDLRSQAHKLFAFEVNRNLKNQTFVVGDYPDAEYTINVKVLDITQGSFMPFSKASALKVEVTFVGKDGESFASIPYKSISNPASSYIPVLVTRIVMSYGALGVSVASVINENLK